MPDRIINRAVALGVFLISLIVYLKTLSATVVFWDVGEFCAASRLLQVPHPPGSPLFLFLARIASLIPFRDDIAARMHAVSATGSALGIMFLYLASVMLIRGVRRGSEGWADRMTVFGGSAVGALTLAFSTTYWDNAIEAEVYGMAMLFVSMILWLALKWREHAEEPKHERYLLIIAYLLGLSSGVHILALLVTIPVLMLVYFHRYEFSRRGFVKFSLIAMGIFFVVYPGIIQVLPGMLDGEFQGIKSDAIPYVPALIVAAAVYGAFYSYRHQKKVLHVACLSFLLIVVGYTTYTQVLIRANVPNLPMNENNPGNLNRLTGYLTREQYGETPMFKGDSWDNNSQDYREKLFPRRWSHDPLHEATRVAYTDDGDFLWRYQINHMFIRYVLWNFVGAQGDWQDAGVSWKDTWGIPLILSLFGLVMLWRKDWKTGSALVVMFIIMGIVLDLYQNQQDPQPRERDYFYVGAYYVMCIWIAFGIVALLDSIRRLVRNASFAGVAAGGALLACAVAAPLNLARINWNDHDRSRLYMAWDYSYNLLQSVDKDGILFTNGDNDTFPLWYLQDVEGVRRDVRIVNLSLANTTWYVRQLKHTTPYNTQPVPISLTDDQIDRLQSVEWDPRTVSMSLPREIAERYHVVDSSLLATGRFSWEMRGVPYGPDMRVLRIQDIVVRDIIATNRWQRPIFFAATVSPDAKIGLDNYLWMEGLSLRLKPVRSAGPAVALDIPMMERNFLARDVVPSTSYQQGFLFRNLNAPGVYFDDNAIRMMFNYRIGFLRVADHFMRIPGQEAEALKVLRRMEEAIPISLVPMHDWSYTFMVARMFFNLGDTATFRVYGTVLEAKAHELIAIGDLSPGDPSKSPYLILSELYGMRGEYPKAIDALQTLAVQFPNTPWIESQIAEYTRRRAAQTSRDTSAAR